MKSPSNSHKHKQNHASNDEQIISKQVNAALTQSADKLPEQVLADLAQARNNALAKLKPDELKSNKSKFSLDIRIVKEVVKPVIQTILNRYFSVLGLKIITPIALALVVTVSFKALQVAPIPALPSAMFNLDIPNEDLALLEDLDFVTWLAQNEQDAFL